jgi:hypothetical protein
MADVRLYHNLHVNSTYQGLVRTVVDMFRNEFFPRVDDVIIGTYHKAVERDRQRKRNAGENYSPKFPFISFNPQLDFEPDQQTGLFFNQYPGYRDYNASREWTPMIYDDGNVYIAPSFNRYKGSWEMILWCSSVYELIDYKTRIFQFFGGYNRIKQPTYEGYFILPDEIKLYNYVNPYTEEEYIIDFSQSLAETHLIKVINQNKLVFPFYNKPFIKLVGVSDGSDRYGSPSDDELSEHRLTVSLEWESWLPTHVILVAKALPIPCKYFQLDIGVGYQYSEISSAINQIVTVPIHKLITYVDTPDSTSLGSETLIWDSSFIYCITQEDVDKFENKENVIVTINDSTMENCLYLNIMSRFGELERDYQWKFLDKNHIKLIYINMSNFVAGDILSFEIYRE